MEEEPLFDERLRQMLDESDVSVTDLESLYRDWLQLSEVTPESNEDTPENNAFVAEITRLGIHVETLGIIGLKVGVEKQRKDLGMDRDDPAIWDQMDRDELLSFAASFAAAYMLGFFEGLKQSGGDPFGDISRAVGKARAENPTAKRKNRKARKRPKPGPMQPPSSMPPLTTTDELGEFLRKQARAMIDVFDEPDDDWSPVMFVASKQKTAMIGLEMPEDEDTKRMLFSVAIPATVKGNFADDRPVAIGMVVSTWTLPPQSDENQEWMRSRERGEHEERISDHPDREEQLVCYLSVRDHDEIWMAQIYRDDEQPPGLGEWKQTMTTVDTGVRLTGNIPKMMRKLLR